MKKSAQTREQLQRELNLLKKQVTRFRKSESELKKKNLKLQECEEKYRSLVEKACDGIAIIQDMALKYVNPELAELLGYSAEHYINKPFTDFIHPDESQKVVDRHKRRLAGEEVPSIYESAIKAKDGRKVLVELNVSHNLYLGKPTTFVFVRDITERKKEEAIRNSVYRISEDAYSAKDLQEFYQTIHKIIAELMPAKDNFYIALRDESTNMLHFPYFVDEEEENPGPQKLGKGLTEYVLRTGRSLLASPRVFADLEKKGEVKSIGPSSIDWLGPGTMAKLKFKGGDDVLEVEVERNFKENLTESTRSNIEKLESDIYYVNLDKASWAEINAKIDDLAKAKGIIFDLRGYPNGNHQVICHLLEENDTSDAWMQIPLIVYPDQENIADYQKMGWRLAAKEPHIGGKAVFITDGRAISYAESFMSFIEFYKLAEIVGQPTAGTNGNINPFMLPGGFRIIWTGMKVLKHDGSQHHLIGIQPTVPAERTIQGVIEGRDEFLEKALEVVKQ